MSSVTPAVRSGKSRGAARRAANAREDNRARLILRDSAKSGRKKFGPFNPVTVWDGVSATQRPRGFLRPPRPSFYLPLSFSPSLFTPLLSVLHPPFLALSPRLALARSGITWRTCMHACMHASTVPACLHACMHLEARMAQLAVQTGVLLPLSLSFSSFLRLAEERRTAAR